MNDTLIKYANSAGITKLSSISCSKEENEIPERANKEVNQLIRNILFDHVVIDECWYDVETSYEHIF